MLAQVLLVVYTFGLCVATKITIGDQLQRICDFIDNSTDGNYIIIFLEFRTGVK